MQTDIVTSIVLPISLFIIMLGMGLSLVRGDFTRVVKAPKAIILGIACQLLLLPLIGLLIVVSMGLTRELAVGILVLSLCPGGTTSNLISYLSRGDAALSISLTAIISLVTPFTIPIFTVLAMQVFLDDTKAFSLPIVKTIIQLLAITILPVIIGMAIRKQWPQFSTKAERPIKVFSILFLFLIIFGIVMKNKSSMAGYFVQTGLATLLLNVLSLSAGYFLAKLMQLNHRQAITIGIEVGIQNGTVALLITGTLLASPMMTIPAVTYSLLMFFTGAIFGFIVRRQQHHNEVQEHV